MEFHTCPYCGVRVVPTADKICPSCRRSFEEPRDIVTSEQESGGQILEPLTQTPKDHITNRFPRIMGTIFLVVGLLLAKWQIYDPLHAAEQRKQLVWIHHGLIALAILLPVYGILLLLFGKKPNEWFVINPKDVRWKNAAILIITKVLQK
jgi:hypothetical protein